MLVGRSEREERTWRKMAWMCALLMNASGNMKRHVKPDDLLGRKKRRPAKGAADVDELVRRQQALEA